MSPAKPIHITRLKQRLLGLVGRKLATYRSVSDRQWTLRPATQNTVPEAIYAASDLDRITGVMADTTLDFELHRIRGGRREHRATLAFLLSDVTLRKGFLKKGNWSHRLLDSPPKPSRDTPEITLPEASIGCTYFGGIYFAHWITDDLTLHLAAQEFGTPIAAERKPYHHEHDYLRLFGLPSTMLARARFPRFVMIDDFSQNAFKAERYQTLRSRLRAASPKPGANPRIYLRRGSKGAPRTLVNTPQVEAFLFSQGFTLVDPDLHAPAEIARLANGARIAISVEGSHMIHGLLNLADDGILCQIQPPYRFNNLFKDYADCLGMRYAFVVGQTAEGGFTLPIEDLQRFLDRVEATPTTA